MQTSMMIHRNRLCNTLFPIFDSRLRGILAGLSGIFLLNKTLRLTMMLATHFRQPLSPVHGNALKDFRT